MNKRVTSNPVVEGSSPSWGISRAQKGAIAGMQGRGQGLPDYLTTDEVAAKLGYNVKYVRRMARNEKLPADKKAGVWLFHREGVEEYKAAVAGKAKHDPTRGS